MNRIISLIILLIFTGFNAWTQDSVTSEQQETQDLKAQYNSLKQNAETYGEYKVFRVSKLDEFWSVVNDSMSVVKENLASKQLVIDDQLVEIDKLNVDFKDNEERFQENEFAASHIEFLGISFSKSTFKITMSIMIGGLSLLLLAGYIQYSHNKRILVQNTTELKKLQSEYDELRRKSLEKQIQLNRELQTERNFIEEMRNKTTISKKISA